MSVGDTRRRRKGEPPSRHVARDGVARNAGHRANGASHLSGAIQGRNPLLALGPAYVTGLQQAAGNRAVQRVATNLVAGLDKDKPSTYDSGGGHSYADHGAHTTKTAHVTRVKTGVAPSGRVSKVPRGKGSSKFASDDKHKLAFNTALLDITAKNLPKQKVRGAANVIDIAGAGTLYYADDTEKAANKVQLDIQPIDDTTIKINSMYPVEG